MADKSRLRLFVIFCTCILNIKYSSYIDTYIHIFESMIIRKAQMNVSLGLILSLDNRLIGNVLFNVKY